MEWKSITSNVHTPHCNSYKPIIFSHNRSVDKTDLKASNKWDKKKPTLLGSMNPSGT